MRILAILSAHPGTGQITVLVNLASGLARQGKRVLIAQLGPCQKLLNWLGLTADAVGNPNDPTVAGTLDAVENQIRPARFGLDFLSMPVFPAEQNLIETLQPAAIQLGYAYLILNLDPTVPETSAFLPSRTRMLICTDLHGENEVAEIEEIQRKLQINQLAELPQNGEGAFPEISLIIPSRVNTKEWARNNRQLSALAEYFGYEKLVDPLPT